MVVAAVAAITSWLLPFTTLATPSANSIIDTLVTIKCAFILFKNDMVERKWRIWLYCLWCRICLQA